MKLWLLWYSMDHVCGVTDNEELAKQWGQREYCDVSEVEINDIKESPWIGAKRWPA